MLPRLRKVVAIAPSRIPFHLYPYRAFAASAASAGPQQHGFLSKAVLILPLCFAIGLSAAELQKGSAEEDAIVERRVQQRLGIWVPPKLSPEDRARLEQERDNLKKDIAVLEAKIAAKKVLQEASGKL